MKYNLYVFLLVLVLVGFTPSSRALSQKEPLSSSGAVSKQLRLVQAAVCEEVKEQSPKNQAIVFSVTIGKVLCFSDFDPVPDKTFIYHTWFHREKRVKKVKLSLKPPRWSTVSAIELREADKGPWRVEISDKTGLILKILRFSISD